MVFSNDQKFELVKLLLSNGLTPSLVVSQIRQIELGLQPGFQDLSNEGKASLGQISVSVNAVAPESLQKALESYRGALSAIYNSQSNSSFVNDLNDLPIKRPDGTTVIKPLCVAVSPVCLKPRPTELFKFPDGTTTTMLVSGAALSCGTER